MSKFTNPLDNIRIASPCTADWNAMIGNERQRHCSECKLNVYNLSAMSRKEAEQLLMNAEGRLCVKFYRRSDGTVLTKDCPVGWKKVKRNISRAATAVFSLIAGLFGGVFAFNSLNFTSGATIGGANVTKLNERDIYDLKESKNDNSNVEMMGAVPIMGNVAMPVREIKKTPKQQRKSTKTNRK